MNSENDEYRAKTLQFGRSTPRESPRFSRSPRETELIHEYCADAAILPECAKDAQHEA
jgi:hypothetical protein